MLLYAATSVFLKEEEVIIAALLHFKSVLLKLSLALQNYYILPEEGIITFFC